MNFTSYGFSIGSLSIHYYGIIMLFGALIGTALAAKLAPLRKLSKDTPWDVLPWALLIGIAGARAWHVLTPSASSGINFSYYLQNPLLIFAVWNGGLGIPGGILGGILGVWIYCKRNKIAFGRLADVMVPGLALAQAIGRWGNFVNQELYGAPSTLPWAITIAPQHRIHGFETIATYHPLFFYESLWNLLNCAILVWLIARKTTHLQDGNLLLIYLIIYPVGRFLLEFLRLDPSLVGGLNVNQTIMGLTAVCATAALIRSSMVAHSKTR